MNMKQDQIIKKLLEKIELKDSEIEKLKLEIEEKDDIITDFETYYLIDERNL